MPVQATSFRSRRQFTAVVGRAVSGQRSRLPAHEPPPDDNTTKFWPECAEAIVRHTALPPSSARR